MLVKQQAKEGSVSYTGEPSIQKIIGHRNPPPLQGDPSLRAFEGMIDAIDYAKRLLAAQSVELDMIFREARVRNGMRKQGFPNDQIDMALGELGFGEKTSDKDVKTYQAGLKKQRDDRDELLKMARDEEEVRLRKSLEDYKLKELAAQVRI